MSTPPLTGIGNAQVLLQGVPAGGGSAGGATSIPPGILALPHGTLLRGNITQIDKSGLAVLQTPKGEITLKTSITLKRGSELVIRLDTSSAGLKARIISIDGHTPKELELAPPTPSPSGLIVEDLVDFPDQIPLPARTTIPEKTAPLPDTRLLEPPVLDTVEISTPQPALLRAILLSRAPDLPQILRQLPPSVQVSPQRLEAGAVITLTLVPDSIALSTTSLTATANTLPMHPPSATNANATTTATATVSTTLAAATTSPAPATISPSAPSAVAPETRPVPLGEQTLPSLQQPQLVRSPSGAYAPNPALAATLATPAASSVPSPAPLAQAPTTNTAPSPPPPTTAITSSPVPAENTSLMTLQQGQIPAQILGREQSGETVLKTPLGILKLDLQLPSGQRPALAPETTLMLQLHALDADTTLPLHPTLSARTEIPASLRELTTSWQGLQETMHLLQQADPALTQSFLQNVFPRPDSHFAKDVLFFLMALKAGDLSEWTGKKTLETLEKLGRGDLTRKLTAEFSVLRQFFIESPNPNWQAAFIPVFAGGEWQQLRLFLKKEPKKSNGNPDEASGTRFIMEVDLSRFGPMQFDGFVRKQVKNTLFDLIIRTTDPLPDPDQQAIRQIFADAAGLTGFRGGLSFQIGQPFPLLPLEEILKSDRNVIA